MINQKPVFLMKHVPVVLAVLLALVSCEKMNVAPYSLSVTDIEPCRARVVANIKTQKTIDVPFFKITVSDNYEMKGTRFYTSTEITDGKMSIPMFNLNPDCYYYYKTRMIIDGVNYDSELMEFKTQDLPVGTIDMGTSVKWASYNLGATKPEESGLRFAWGETAPKSAFSWDNYLWWNGNDVSKYLTEDEETVLEKEDDAAHAILGGNWRMPTLNDFGELFQSGSHALIKYKGVRGIGFRSSSTKQTLFFPTEITPGDDLFYWMSSRKTKLPIEEACSFPQNGTSATIQTSSAERYKGGAIRPVLPE